MRLLILAAAVSLMLLCAGQAAAADVGDEPEGCDGTTGEMLDCNIEHSRRADLELERYLAAARKKLADDAAENAADWPDTKETLPRFEAAQAAWSAEPGWLTPEAGGAGSTCIGKVIASPQASEVPSTKPPRLVVSAGTIVRKGSPESTMRSAISAGSR